jgi:hypothetical protein
MKLVGQIHILPTFTPGNISIGRTYFVLLQRKSLNVILFLYYMIFCILQIFFFFFVNYSPPKIRNIRGPNLGI